MRRSRLASAFFPGDQDGICVGAGLVDQAVNALHLRGDADRFEAVAPASTGLLQKAQFTSRHNFVEPKGKTKRQASRFRQRS